MRVYNHTRQWFGVPTTLWCSHAIAGCTPFSLRLLIWIFVIFWQIMKLDTYVNKDIKNHVNPPEQPLKADCSVVVFNKSILFRTRCPFFLFKWQYAYIQLEGFGGKKLVVCIITGLIRLSDSTLLKDAGKDKVLWRWIFTSSSN